MKRFLTITKHIAATVSVFALTFVTGFGASNALLHEMDDEGSALGAVLLRSASRTNATGSQLSSARKTKARVVRGVKRAVIVRPRTRSGSGASSESVRPSAPKMPIKASCGDKLVIKDLAEECDDGNILAGDGCSDTCKVEAGFYCGGTPSICVSRCGDGVITPKEKCDDNNVESGDGCSASCKTEFGYTCTATPSFCEPTPYCGDGVKASTEQCDDANSDRGDGCFDCKTE